MLDANKRTAGPYEPLGHNDFFAVLIGASAVGKSTTAKGLHERGVAETEPTWTDRAPRPGETSTQYDHRFVTPKQFETQSSKGAFIDEQALYGNRYGAVFPQSPANGRIALMVLKPCFMRAVIRHFPYVRIYQIEAPIEVLRARMIDRGQSQADIDARMRTHDSETADAREYAHAVFDNSGSPDKTIQAVANQIRIDVLTHEVLRADFSPSTTIR